MAELKKHILTGLADLERRCDEISKLPTAMRGPYIDNLNPILNSVESDITEWQKTRLGAVDKKLGNEWEEELMKFQILKNNLLEGKDRKDNEQKEVDNELNLANFSEAEKNLIGAGVMMEQKSRGDKLIEKGKAKIQSMQNAINNMNEVLNDIEEEIMNQKEALTKTNEVFQKARGMLDLSKKMTKDFSKLLYQDLIIKILIGFIAVAIIAIFVMAKFYKNKKVATVTQDLRNQSEITAAEYQSIMEVLFDENAISQSKQNAKNSRKDAKFEHEILPPWYFEYKKKVLHENIEEVTDSEAPESEHVSTDQDSSEKEQKSYKRRKVADDDDSKKEKNAKREKPEKEEKSSNQAKASNQKQKLI